MPISSPCQRYGAAVPVSAAMVSACLVSGCPDPEGVR